MDMMAMVSSMLAMQAGGLQQQIQTSIIKQNNDAEKSAVQTLLGTPSTANLAAGRRRQSERCSQPQEPHFARKRFRTPPSPASPPP